MTDELVRVFARAPLAEAEIARAALLDLVPEGFEESDDKGRITFVLYVAKERLEAILPAFPAAAYESLEPGWEDAWRAFHRPARVGGIWIGPPWEEPPPGEPAVVIDPGRAFGTGAHPTTRLCVDLLATAPRGSLLDVGCGSGVLAIAAARLGYGPLTAVDNDLVAVETTRANAVVNDVMLVAYVADAAAERLPAADVAVANILLTPVEEVLRRLESRYAITSGYLTGERPVAPGWAQLERREADGWAAHLFCREAMSLG